MAVVRFFFLFVLGVPCKGAPGGGGGSLQWAYAGFGFDFIAAFISIWAVAGFGVNLILPVVFMILLVLSYKSYHKMHHIA